MPQLAYHRTSAYTIALAAAPVERSFTAGSATAYPLSSLHPPDPLLHKRDAPNERPRGARCGLYRGHHAVHSTKERALEPGRFYFRPMDVRAQLRNKGFRITALRTDLLRLLQESDRALTQTEVEQHLAMVVDRATVFRALNAFEEAGLIHRVLDGTGTSRFAACAGECTHGQHNDAHAHFHCRTCGSVFCLPTVELPKVNVPRGFRMEKGHLELQGTCKACA